MEIIFNVKYLTDVLGVLETPECGAGAEHAAESWRHQPVDESDYVYVIMPMHSTR